MENIARTYGLDIQMYADDTQLYFSFPTNTVGPTEDILKRCMQAFKTWMNNNYLKLNDEKTQFTVFNSKSITSLPIQLNLCIANNQIILPTNKLKILGITITPTINFHTFITNKVRSCSFHLRNFSTIRKCLPISARITLVTTLILPQMDYGNALLVGCTDKDLKPLQRVLNRAIRYIFPMKRNEHITPYLYKLHILPIRHRINYKICLLAFKIKRKITADYLIETFEDFQPTTAISLRIGPGRDETMFKVFDQIFHNRSLFCKLVSQWNGLPLPLRKIISLTAFKTRLKTHFFKLAFSEFIT